MRRNPLLMAVVCILAVHSVNAQTTYYVRTDGSDASSGLSWAAAKQTIQAAVDLTTSNDTVIVSNGTYNITSWVQVTNDISVLSVNGPDVTIIDAGGVNGRRVCHINATNALVAGFTMTRGNISAWDGPGALLVDAGTVTNCIITASKAYLKGGAAQITGGAIIGCVFYGNQGHANGSPGGAINITGGLVANCTITNNTVWAVGADGGGIYMTGGVVSNCLVRDNFAYDTGGGICALGGEIKSSRVIFNKSDGTGGGLHLTDALAVNCLVYDNDANNQGGGIYVAAGSARVLNCTVSDNVCLQEGAGIYMAGGAVTNTIAYFNGAESYAAAQQNVYMAGGEFDYGCTVPAIAGTGNIVEEPLFLNRAADDYRLFPLSSCVDSGSNIVTVTDDLVGSLRPVDGNNDGTNRHDMGAYESANVTNSSFACHLSAATNEGYISLNVVLTAHVAGPNTNIIWYGWDFEDNGSIDYSGPNAKVATNTYGIGFHDVTLTVSNDTPAGTSLTRIGYIRVAPATNYVSLTGSHTAPFDTWAKAANNIQAAINAAGVSGGATPLILVSNGTYNISAQINIQDDLQLRSVNGPNVTIIDAGNISPRRVCVVSATNAVVDGFTMQRGLYSVWDGPGGLLLTAGTVTNCIITANKAYLLGAGVRVTGGTLIDCVIHSNDAHAGGSTGGGINISGGAVINCTITNNTAIHGAMGGGVYMTGGVVSNCLVKDNQAGYASNPNGRGGGIYMNGGEISHCEIADNQSFNMGGGVRMLAGLVRNCLFVNNSAEDTGGGGIYMSGGAVESCTVSDNSALQDGDGVYMSGGTISNTIMYFNNTDNLYTNGGSVSYSCVTPAHAGESNIVNEPMFSARVSGDYGLSVFSPCLDIGSNQSWMVSASDLAGTNRIINGIVDMGAYESQGPGSGPLQVSFTSPTNSGNSSLEAVFSALLAGTDTNNVYYWWDFGDSNTIEGYGLGTVTNSYVAGYYTVTLTVSNSSVEVTNMVRTSYVQVIPVTNYVAKGGSDTPPYHAWAYAASNVSDAVNVGATVIVVSNGTYSLPGTINILSDITIRSVNGPEVTILDAMDVVARRVFNINSAGAVVDGFTAKRGRMQDWGDGGGCVKLTIGTVTNCIIQGGYSYIRGGGIWVRGGLLTHSTISGNTGHANNSYGGGLYLEGNGVVQNCIITSNRVFAIVPRGAGACVVGGTMRSCLVAYNKAEAAGTGAGIYATGGSIENCTIVTNNAYAQAGGVHSAGGAFTNCIVWYNTSPTDSDLTGTNYFANSCSPDLNDGIDGNVTGDPLFVDWATGDFHLDKGSPCINRGANHAWMDTAVDLDGNVRKWLRVDMGAYETTFGGGTVIVIR